MMKECEYVTTMEWLNIGYETWTLWGVWLSSIATSFAVVVALYLGLSSQWLKMKIESEKWTIGKLIGKRNSNAQVGDTKLTITNICHRQLFVSEYGIIFKKHLKVTEKLSPTKKMEIGESIEKTIRSYDIESVFELVDEHEYGRLRYYVRISTGKMFYSTVRWGRGTITKEQKKKEMEARERDVLNEIL